MRRLLKVWWPAIIMCLWLSFVAAITGAAAAFLAGVTGLAVALLALWEAGEAQ